MPLCGSYFDNEGFSVAYDVSEACTTPADLKDRCILIIASDIKNPILRMGQGNRAGI